MKRFFAAAVLVLSVAPAAGAFDDEVAPGEDYTIRAEIRRWMPSLGAQIQKNFTGGEGTIIDVPADLGVEDHGLFHVRGTLQIGSGKKIRGSYSRIDYDGDKKVERQIRFGGTTYAISTRVITSVRSDLYTLDYEWDIVHRPEGYFGVLIGAKALKATTVLIAPDLGDRKQEAVNVPVPVLGLTGRFYAGQISGFAELSGLTIGQRGHVTELDLGVHVDIVKPLGAGIGYRRIVVHGENDDGLLDFKVGGLYLGVDASF
jgi:hypothetical protein